MQHIDAAYKRLVDIRAELDLELTKPMNEAATRFRILDRILTEVLGWQHDQVLPEEPVMDGFIDYNLVNLEGSSQIIVEAKKNGRLSPPTASHGGGALALSGAILKTFMPAIKQALGYAQWKSVPLACVTDGNAWLFFKANRQDGRPVTDGKGILFPSLSSVITEFPKFHDLLSFQGTSDRLGLLQLNKAEGVIATTNELQVVVAPCDEARLLPQGELARDAANLFSKFFSNITSDADPDMLRHCFVETPESRRADHELELIAQKLLNTVSTLDSGTSEALQEEIERSLASMQSETILIIGNKGSGKSTFLTRFFADVLSDSLKNRCIVVKVSLDKFTGDMSSLVNWSIKQIRDQLETAVCTNAPPSYDDLRGVFWTEYRRQKEGALKPLYETDENAFRIEFGRHMEREREVHPEAYIQCFLERCVYAEKKLPCIIYDNADQFSPAIQDAIFQLAHSINSNAPAVLNIVPITDRTVWRLSKAGALQSYPSKSFYLPVPEAKAILTKRISYVKNKLSGDDDGAKSYFSKQGFKVTLPNISKIADAVERTFVDNDFVSGQIGRLTNFDIRRMLKLAERIFLSPEIRIDDVLRGSFGVQSGKADILRIHRAMIKGQYDRYNDTENEYVYNLFWTNPTSPTSPLASFFVLWLLKHRFSTSKDNNIDSRYWLVSDILAYFEVAGIQPDQLMILIQRLRDRALVEPLDPTSEIIHPSHRISATEAAIAHIDLVLHSQVYMEQMALATGLNSRASYEKIKELKNRMSSDSFTDMRRIFADYLLQVDAIRVSIPNPVDYSGVSEARKFVRGLSGIPLSSAPARASNGYQPRSAPAPSVGGIMPSRKR